MTKLELAHHLSLLKYPIEQRIARELWADGIQNGAGETIYPAERYEELLVGLDKIAKWYQVPNKSLTMIKGYLKSFRIEGPNEDIPSLTD